MAIDFEHTTGFVLTGGLFGQIWALKIFSVGASINWDLLGIFGIQVNAGPYDNTSTNTIGQNLQSPGAAMASNRKKVKFVLEPETVLA